jgi:hypothetical protein
MPARPPGRFWFARGSVPKSQDAGTLIAFAAHITRQSFSFRLVAKRRRSERIEVESQQHLAGHGLVASARRPELPLPGSGKGFIDQ